MCGLCGLIGFPPGPERDAALQRMSVALAHRGPDDARSWSDAHAALGFRRLSILDLEGGAQPMPNEDGTLHLMLNGEIYNHRDLRRTLEARGHRFRSRGDAESALHLYEDEGPASVERLKGMFALAIWDARDRSLFLARDRMGKKPLAYWTDGARFAFASELQALASCPWIARDRDVEAIGLYLARGYVPAPRSMFQWMRKLRPGHWARWKRDHLELRDFRSPAPSPEPMSRAEAADRVRTVVTEAVEARLESDVPLGAFLSGGIDSSIVVGVMARAGREPVRTFTIGFEDSAFNEAEPARRVARHFGTRHLEFVVSPDVSRLLPKIARHYGEPFADASALPTFELARLASAHVKVALSGDGGDECFGGYRRYRAVRLLSRLKKLPRPVQWAARWAPIERAYRKRARAALERMDEPLGALYAELLAPVDAETRARLGFGVDGLVAEFESDDPVEAAARDDMERYLPDDLLVKTDIASMAHGVEVRCPFVDPAVVNVSRRIPSELKIRGRVGKAILRQAFQDLLPPETLRRSKQGFGIPLDAWLRGPLRSVRDDHLLDRTARARGIFDAREVERLVRQHDGGADHGRALWAFIVFEAWARWVDSLPSADSPCGLESRI